MLLLILQVHNAHLNVREVPEIQTLHLYKSIQ